MRVPARFVFCALAAVALLAGPALAQGSGGGAAGDAPAHADGHAQSAKPHRHGTATAKSQAQQEQLGASGAHRHERADGKPAADAALSLEPERPQAGERATLSFTLTDGEGRPLERLLTSHARKLHVVIVSDDMEMFGHVHPEDFGQPAEGALARVFFTFPRAGRYLVATDFMTDAGPHAEHFVAEVAGDAPEAESGADVSAKVALVEADEDDRYIAPILLDGGDTAEGYAVSLAMPARIAAGKPASFAFRVAKNGAPVTDLRPYLDAAMHVAVVKEDLSEFLHAHGTAFGQQADGQRAAGSHAHSGREAPDQHGAAEAHGPASFGPEVTATINFPEPGRYHLFGQTAHGNKLLIARFPVEVR